MSLSIVRCHCPLSIVNFPLLSILIDQLQKRYAQGLPGRSFQLELAFSARIQSMEAPPTAKKSAVLVLIYEKNNEPHVLLIERVGHAKDPHSQQISFPGGKFDADDVTIENCALRECFEEVGIPSSQIEIIGLMTHLYIPVSNFEVFPVLAFSKEKFILKPQPTEVKQILETPISLLLKPETIKHTEMKAGPQQILMNVPYFDVFEKKIWGATAMILSELLALMKTM